MRFPSWVHPAILCTSFKTCASQGLSAGMAQKGSIASVKAGALRQLAFSSDRFQLGRLGCDEVPQALALPRLAEPVLTSGRSRSRRPGLLGRVARRLGMRCRPVAAVAIAGAALLRLPGRQMFPQDLHSSGPAVTLLCVAPGRSHPPASDVAAHELGPAENDRPLRS